MEQDIIDYFESRGHHIHKLVGRRPRRIREDNVMLAISDIYDEIQKGREIPNISLAREIWRKAYDYPNRDLHRRFGFVRAGEKSLKRQINLLKLGIGACGIALIVLIILIILNL